MKYKFKAKDTKTGELVEGDLVYAQVANFKTGISIKKKPMIVTMHIYGGMMWVGNRYFVDEDTIELIQE